MEKTIQKLEARVCDKYPLEEKFELFELGDDLEINLKGSIVKKEIKDNQDGSVDIVLHFKALDYTIISEEK